MVMHALSAIQPAQAGYDRPSKAAGHPVLVLGRCTTKYCNQPRSARAIRAHLLGQASIPARFCPMGYINITQPASCMHECAKALADGADGVSPRNYPMSKISCLASCLLTMFKVLMPLCLARAIICRPRTPVATVWQSHSPLGMANSLSCDTIVTGLICIISRNHQQPASLSCVTWQSLSTRKTNDQLLLSSSQMQR